MFKATLPSFEFATDLTGNITVPQILGPGEWYRSETQTDVFNMRRTTKSRGAVSYPVSISESKMAPDKQVETIVSKLDLGLQTLVPTPTMVEGEVQNLGDGSSIMKTGSTPVVFGGKTSIKEIPDTIPPEFRAAVPMYERELTFTGTVTDPQILGVGELYRKEQQLDVFNMRQTVRSIGAPTLPITLTEYKLTPEQQLATVTKKLDLGLQTLVPTPTMVGGEVVNLGNGTSILKTEVVPVVFSHIKYELVFPDLIPAEFRASFPTLKVTQTLPGLAALPTPGIGDLALSDEQITDLTHRASISTRSSVSLPQIIIGQEVTEDYGGGVLNNIKTLDASGLVVDTGYNIVSSVVKPLGNGLDLKETRQLADVSWPTLTSIIWDDEMQSYSTEEEQVVPAGTTPTSGTGFNESIKAIDKWR
ncbi:MAG TPA: hypothetical protein VFH87_06505, partial [Candidatus Udaeobacter sp.]|nr:hypothetical protein [Candidatus Udaeobacter sp.]